MQNLFAQKNKTKKKQVAVVVSLSWKSGGTVCWADEVLSATVIEEVQIALHHVLWWKKASPACMVVWFNAKVRLHGTGKACSGFVLPVFQGEKKKGNGDICMSMR